MDDFKNLTVKQILFVCFFTFITLSSIFVIAIILDTLIYCLAIFIVFSIANSFIEKYGHKEHAPSVKVRNIKIESIYMCYVVSNLMFLLCMVVMKYSHNLMGTVQASILGIILIAFASIVLSGIFYWKPKGDSNYKILIDYIKFNGITDEMIQAESLLKKRVTSREYILYKRVLVDGRGRSSAWDECEIEFNVHRQKIKEALDKCYCYMIGRLDL